MNQMSAGIPEYYATIADLYDEAASKWSRHFAPEWIGKRVHDLDGLSECRVLDLGCGTGMVVKCLSEHREGIHAEGVDVSPKMLEYARATGRYEKLYTLDLHNGLPEIASEAFDLVVAFACLEHLFHPFPCLTETYRVLKVEGRLWASFKAFEADDDGSPPRRRAFRGDLTQTGYSAAEILHMMRFLNMRLIALDLVVGYITSSGLGCPYYVLRAQKTSAPAQDCQGSGVIPGGRPADLTGTPGPMTDDFGMGECCRSHDTNSAR
jgi:SAM-dependent methyltransferase